MEITVKVPPTFRRPDLMNKKIEVDSGITIQQFITKVKLSPTTVAGAMVNDLKVPLTQELTDGDFLSIIPMVTGG